MVLQMTLKKHFGYGISFDKSEIHSSAYKHFASEVFSHFHYLQITTFIGMILLINVSMTQAYGVYCTLALLHIKVWALSESNKITTARPRLVVLLLCANYCSIILMYVVLENCEEDYITDQRTIIVLLSSSRSKLLLF